MDINGAQYGTSPAASLAAGANKRQRSGSQADRYQPAPSPGKQRCLQNPALRLQEPPLNFDVLAKIVERVPWPQVDRCGISKQIDLRMPKLAQLPTMLGEFRGFLQQAYSHRLDDQHNPKSAVKYTRLAKQMDRDVLDNPYAVNLHQNGPMALQLQRLHKSDLSFFGPVGLEKLAALLTAEQDTYGSIQVPTAKNAATMRAAIDIAHAKGAGPFKIIGRNLIDTQLAQLVPLGAHVKIEAQLLNTVSVRGFGHLLKLQTIAELDLRQTIAITTDEIIALQQLDAVNALKLPSYQNLGDEALQAVNQLKQLTYLSLANCKGFSVEALAPFHGNSNLRALDLSNSKLASDASLGDVTSIAKLERLTMRCVAPSRCNVLLTPAGFAKLARLDRLRSLDLRYNSTLNNYTDSLTKITQLEHLDLGSTSLTDASLQGISSLQNLRSLELPLCHLLSSNVLTPILAITTLTRLNMIDTKLESRDIVRLERLPQLQELQLPAVSESQFFTRLAKLPAIRVIQLHRISTLAYEHVRELARCTSLESLDLRFELQHRDARSMAQLPLAPIQFAKNLTTLDVRYFPMIASHHFEEISRSTGIETLQLYSCNIARTQAIEQLKNMPKLKTLSLALSRGVDKASVLALSRLRQLKCLNLPSCSDLLDMDVRDLQKNLPYTVVKTTLD